MDVKTLREGTVLRITEDTTYVTPGPGWWEIVSEPDPEWWTAKVIKADYIDPYDDTMDTGGAYFLNDGDEGWLGVEADYNRRGLTNVEVIVP